MADIYILDSNVLLADPHAIYKFPETEVVIPGVVIEEIDAKKRGCDGTAYNARQLARHLESLRQHGSLHQPTPLGNGGLLRVELNHRSLDMLRDHFPEVNNDNRLLAVALNLQLEGAGRSTREPFPWSPRTPSSASRPTPSDYQPKSIPVKSRPHFICRLRGSGH